MSQIVCAGANCLCSFGTAPGTINPSSQTKVLVDGKPAATIQDCQIANITAFGMCTSMANPQVAAATAAALGVLTPQPCMLMAAGTWVPGKATVLLDGKPALTNDSKLLCSNGMGNISITNPGQFKATV